MLAAGIVDTNCWVDVYLSRLIEGHNLLQRRKQIEFFNMLLKALEKRGKVDTQDALCNKARQLETRKVPVCKAMTFFGKGVSSLSSRGMFNPNQGAQVSHGCIVLQSSEILACRGQSHIFDWSKSTNASHPTENPSSTLNICSQNGLDTKRWCERNAKIVKRSGSKIVSHNFLRPSMFPAMFPRRCFLPTRPPLPHSCPLH